MSARFAFDISSEDRRRKLPERVYIGLQQNEGVEDVLLKLLAFVLFHRERIQIDARLNDDNIPFTPDLVELDYSLHPTLWVECGEVTVTRLDKLAVKVPEAELWVVKRSLPEAEDVIREMARHKLRRDRYRVLALDSDMFDEALASLGTRNELFWVRGDFEPPALQFDLNGLWFDCEFQVLRF